MVGDALQSAGCCTVHSKQRVRAKLQACSELGTLHTHALRFGTGGGTQLGVLSVLWAAWWWIVDLNPA
jgi:hypothetical protein